MQQARTGSHSRETDAVGTHGNQHSAQATNTALISEIVGSECSTAQQIAADTEAFGDNLVQRGYQGFPAADMAPVSECPQSDSNAICGSYRLLVLVRACPGVATPRKGPDTRLTYQGAECRPMAEMRRINNMARG